MNINADDYLVGIPLIDNQHIHYLEMVIGFVNCYKKNEMSETKLIRYFNDINAYVIEHLDAEEYLMFSKGYPLLEEHRAKHNAFRNKMDIFLREVNKPVLNIDVTFKRMCKWLVDWFKLQVQDDDIKLARFLNENR